MNNNTRVGMVIALVVVIVLVVAILRTERQVTESPVANNLVSTVSYTCDAGKTITAAFYQVNSSSDTSAVAPGQPPVPTGTVNLSLSDGRSMTLAQTISADGARYQNADGTFVFWSKGNGALVLENNEQKSYIGCIVSSPTGTTGGQTGGSSTQVYSNSAEGFSIRLPNFVDSSSSQGDSYKVDESYSYQANGADHVIKGIKFTIPSVIAAGTNLAADSYISVEQIPRTSICTANPFAQSGAKISTVTDNGVKYSFASSTDAGAGNRYEEMVYAIPGTNPCVAVRYFIHYGVIDNYPKGTVKEFDKQALIGQFDVIRRSLTLNQ